MSPKLKFPRSEKSPPVRRAKDSNPKALRDKETRDGRSNKRLRGYRRECVAKIGAKR
jgi:hypothetical protein